MKHTPVIQPLDGLGHDWAVVRLRIRKAYLLIGAIYLTSGEGFRGTNAAKLFQLAQCLSYFDAYHHLVGDLNEEPQDWPHRLLKKMHTVLTPPQGTPWTCNQGQMRLLDYSLSSPPIAATVSLLPDWFSPTSPHIGLYGSLTARPQTQLCRKVVPPQEFPFIQIRQDEIQGEMERVKARRQRTTRAAIRKRLVRFLEKQGYSLQQATGISGDPPYRPPRTYPP